MSEESDIVSQFKRSARGEASALIAQVRLYACLWDRAHEHYRVRYEKEAAWRAVYRALEPHYEDLPRADQREIATILTRRWNNIRDTYKKYIETRERQPEVARTRTAYCHADQLGFLDPYFVSRGAGAAGGAKARHSSHKFEYEFTPDADQENEEWLQDIDHQDDEPDDSPSPSPSKRVKQELEYRPKVEAEVDVVSVLCNLLDKEEDEDRAFLKSITPAVQALSTDAKFLFRIETMKLLDSLRKKSRHADMQPAVLTDTD